MSKEELKSYIKSYYLDRKMKYTKLDKHDRAIGVLLEENKQLKEDKNKLRDYIVDELKEYEKGIENYKRFGIEDYTKGLAVGYKKCLEILGDEEDE